MAGERKMIPTGIKMSIPSGFEGQVRPRSGNAIKKGLTVLNTPGTIDSDYTGEICVILVNLGSTFQTVSRGDKIAQLVVCPITRVNLVQTTEFEATIRGEGGFGSTDRK
jgi:dUTP pyrophosphatase